MIASFILMSLGGRCFLETTKSKKLVNMGNALKMNLDRNKTSANRLVITLDENTETDNTETYTMYFYREVKTKNTGTKTKLIVKHEKVNCDMFQKIFTSVTGLATK